MALELFEEPVPPTGGPKAEGARRVLGTPSMGALTVVLREAVQNSWDAKVGDNVTFSMAYYRPADGQRKVLLETLFAQQPRNSRLREQIGRADFGVLLFSDRGTCGLNGPVRADVPPEEPGARRNFVDFMFEIGRDEGKGIGGGTYGFGKSAFFALSASGTVCVHTRCLHNGILEERLMAAHLGASIPGRTTGRAWWGVIGGGNPEPLTGPEAGRLAAALGMPAFSGDECGTTIMVLAPRLVSDGDDRPAEERATTKDVITSLGTSIVQWFWPKMVPGRDGKPAISFAMSYEGTTLPVPPPASHHPYSAFAEALAALDEYKRTGTQPADGTVTPIHSQRPAALLGHLCLLRRPKRSRRTVPGDFEEESARELSDQSHHVALLRGPRLVVRYLAGPKPPSELIDVAGVFLVDEFSLGGEIENAFALSEPPVHDDWVAAALVNRNHKIFVKGALKRVREQLAEFVLPFTEPGADAAPQPGLGAFSEMMGGLLITTSGTGARAQPPRGPGGGGGNGGGGSKPRIEVQPGTLRLDPVHGRVLVVPFSIDQSESRSDLEVRAASAVMLEGGTEQEPPAGTESPEVKAFVFHPADSGPSVVHAGSVATVALGTAGTWEAITTVPRDARVKLTLSVSEVS